MKVHLTEKERNDLNILKEPLQTMTTGQRLTQALKTPKCIFAAILVLVFAGFSLWLFNPKADVEVIVLTSAFEPDASFRREITAALKRYAADIDKNGVGGVRVHYLQNAPEGNPYMTLDRQKAAAEKLQNLLDSGRKFLFFADGVNLAWLDQQGYTARLEDGSAFAVSYGLTGFQIKLDDPFEFMNKGDGYANLLADFSFSLSSGEALSGSENVGQTELNGYLGALSTLKNLNPSEVTPYQFILKQIEQTSSQLNAYS